ncbi:MAG: RidA family protein [Bacteroidetes bacterium]|jgi:enamine deaminase RidA (YjgF/YER057c/UK114 family)|nr:RidA family protein [Bacteroidota bacterium]
MKRQNISSGAVWEDMVGYSRAVKIGNIIEVAGTTAVRDGEVVGKDDLYTQTKCILEIIEDALKEAGATLSDVCRTRMYVTDISQWEAAGKAHGEFFGAIKPASTMVEVSGLVNPDMLIEIEATAILS